MFLVLDGLLELFDPVAIDKILKRNTHFLIQQKGHLLCRQFELAGNCFDRQSFLSVGLIRFEIMYYLINQLVFVLLKRGVNRRIVFR